MMIEISLVCVILQKNAQDITKNSQIVTISEFSTGKQNKTVEMETIFKNSSLVSPIGQ